MPFPARLTTTALPSYIPNHMSPNTQAYRGELAINAIVNTLIHVLILRVAYMIIRCIVRAQLTPLL